MNSSCFETHFPGDRDGLLSKRSVSPSVFIGFLTPGRGGQVLCGMELLLFSFTSPHARPTMSALPAPRRVVTNHDSTGKAIVWRDDAVNMRELPGSTTQGGLVWLTDSFPANVQTNVDAATLTPAGIAHPSKFNKLELATESIFTLCCSCRWLRSAFRRHAAGRFVPPSLHGLDRQALPTISTPCAA